MGEIFDNIVIFLEDYYVYVIGVGLIIILMLVGFLASKRKARKANKQEGQMANINDVNTGSINDVASTIQNSAMEQPTMVNPAVAPAAVVPESLTQQPVVTPEPIEQPTFTPEPLAQQSFGPINQTTVAPMADLSQPVQPIVSPEIPIVTPTANPLPETSPVAPAVDEQKTEVIDLSAFASTPSSSDMKMGENPPFVVDKSQYNSNDILNGENGSSQEPRV